MPSGAHRGRYFLGEVGNSPPGRGEGWVARFQVLSIYGNIVTHPYPFQEGNPCPQLRRFFTNTYLFQALGRG
jgi:hypothetical protein